MQALRQLDKYLLAAKENGRFAWTGEAEELQTDIQRDRPYFENLYPSQPDTGSPTPSVGDKPDDTAVSEVPARDFPVPDFPEE